MQTSLPNDTARVNIEPGFVWDRQDAYLFDIDGTVLRSRDRVHMDSFVPSILKVTGLEISLAGVSIHGSTDTAILRDAFELAHLPADVLELHSDAILEAVRQNVASRRHLMDLRRMPGIEETLRYLASKGAMLGLATGNLETIGWGKVELVGLREWFQFGGFSDRFPVRSELIGDAARQARALTFPSASVCVVGDTPSDIAAAHANSLPVIAVATGNFSFDTLLELEPEVCASSLADLLAFTQAIQ
jgi:phosphoglycolate phosphatase-like HAD superfamily hydrolase